MSEQPWPQGQLDAVLRWPRSLREDVGELWFLSPESTGWHAGEPCCIHVSKDVPDGGDYFNKTNIWQIRIHEDAGYVTVRPSIHFIDHFHSPNPVSFRLVEKLDD